ncbi:MAG TPA: hypothetical protein PKE26_00515 [Kiritimatiellia bacterium]|nr:hypothetical protein [Kiritimatiellia bacterium]HMO97575.1 hypothetical protein [Kiritimatiellia bacterium]HMP96772.1 hypothetical protein [Kiritimatiellia bacterium]
MMHLVWIFRILAFTAILVLASDYDARAETVSFTTPGGPYTFTVPAGVTSIRARAVGGGGGSFQNGVVLTRGADVTATLPVSPGETFTSAWRAMAARVLPVV